MSDPAPVAEARELIRAGRFDAAVHLRGLDLLERQLLPFFTNHHVTDASFWGLRGVPAFGPQPEVEEQRAAHHTREQHADEDGRHVPAHEEALGDPVGDGLAEVAGLALDHGARAPHQSTAT